MGVNGQRIWHEGLVDMCIESNLADRNKEAINKAMIVRSGKDISWYSFRHSFITFRLNAGHPIKNRCTLQYINRVHTKKLLPRRSDGFQGIDNWS